MSGAELVPHPQLSACVIIPAKNEADHLPAAFDALRLQIDLTGKPLASEEYEVIVLINNSTDDSLTVVEQYRRAHPRFRLLVIHRDFESDDAHIGNVRRMLMNEASARLRFAARSEGLILSTDADTEVSPDWIAQNWKEIRSGAEAVGGRIQLRTSELSHLAHRTREIQLLDEQYRLLVAWLEDRYDPQAHDPWPRHHQHFGGSLAVTVSAYEKVGGLPPERTLEDLAFYRLLVRNDVRFRHSPDVLVRTSPRLQGRTEIGLAEQLTCWAASGKSALEIPVPSVYHLRSLFHLRREFRRLWSGDSKNVRQFSAAARVPEGSVAGALSCQSFGAAFEALRLEQSVPQTYQTLQRAVTLLRQEFDAAHPGVPGVPFCTSLLDNSRHIATMATPGSTHEPDLPLPGDQARPVTSGPAGVAHPGLYASE